MGKKNMSGLTHERLLSVLDYNPVTGAVTRREKSNRNKNKVDDAGCVGQNGRRYITIDGKQHIAHRLVWFYVNGAWPENNLAPKDGDYINLAIDNWSEETQAETTRRRKSVYTNTSGIRGVYFDRKRNKWVAQINANYKNHHLGRFNTKEEAGAAYEAARISLLGNNSLHVSNIVEKRERSVIRARCRHFYRRMMRNAGRVSGWSTFDAFFEEFASVEWKHNRDIVAIDQTKAIGPGNWKWEDTLYSKFDTSTRDGRIAYMRAHRAAYPMTYKNGSLQRDFGIGLEDYNRMLSAQGNVCAICRKPETTSRGGKVVGLAVDHCHRTGAVRGLLCKSCNNGIGHLLDDPEIVDAAAVYLRHHAAKPQPDHPAYAFQSKYQEKER